jgi:ATP-dependent Clp protease ATP-binding subunit ClpC
MFERYTEKARRVIFFARYEASQFGSPYIESEHLLLGILSEDKALTNRFLRSQVESIRTEVESQTTIREKVSTSVDLPLSNECKRVLAYAGEEADRLAQKHIGTEHLLLGLLREEKCFAAQILMERGAQVSRVREDLARQPHEAIQGQQRVPVAELSPYTNDPTDKTQPLIGREKELDRLIELLCRFTRKNPVLVGETGVGKTTIVAGLARRIAEGNVPQSLSDKSILGLDLPIFRVLEKGTFWWEKLDRALVAAAGNGKIFFVNRMHDRPSGISPVAPIHVTDLLQRPIMAGLIRCIGTSTPASFARLQAEGHWLAQYFEPVEVAPANEETALQVLQGIKGAYEKFHDVSYEDDALAHAVLYASRCIKKGYLPGIAVDVIDEAGAAAQLQQGSLPAALVDIQKRIRLIAQRMESAITNHEFEKARFYSDEERKERLNLKAAREQLKLNEDAFVVRREDVEKAVSKLAGMSIDAIRRS